MDKKYFLAKKLLIGCRLSIVDATRLIKNILDAKPSNSPFTDIQFVAKVIEVGLRNIRTPKNRSRTVSKSTSKVNNTSAPIQSGTFAASATV